MKSQVLASQIMADIWVKRPKKKQNDTLYTWAALIRTLHM